MSNYSNLSFYAALSQVNIYVINLNEDFVFHPYLNWFNNEVQQKIKSYRFSHDQLRAFTSQLLQRYYLAYLNNIPPLELLINYTKYHKPYIANHGFGGFAFNLSHCNNKVVMATFNGSGYTIGVDIESIDSAMDIQGMSKIVFSPSEHSLINNSPDNFFKLWTKKEALIKAIGTGFVTDFYQSTNINLEDMELTENYCIKTQKLEDKFLSVCLYKQQNINI